jgi:hypothetical protein
VITSITIDAIQLKSHNLHIEGHVEEYVQVCALAVVALFSLECQTIIYTTDADYNAMFFSFRYHFFLQLKKDIVEGKLVVPYKSAVVLASYSVQCMC